MNRVFRASEEYFLFFCNLFWVGAVLFFEEMGNCIFGGFEMIEALIAIIILGSTIVGMRILTEL